MDMDSIPAKKRDITREEFANFTFEERQFLSLANGRRSINHISYVLNIVEDDDVESIVEHLRGENLIE